MNEHKRELVVLMVILIVAHFFLGCKGKVSGHHGEDSYVSLTDMGISPVILENFVSIDTYEDGALISDPELLVSPGEKSPFVYFYDGKQHKIGKIGIGSNKVVMSFGDFGTGPGEISSISSLDVYRDTVYVWDWEMMRLSKFSATDGAFLESHKVSYFVFNGRIMNVDQDGFFIATMNEEVAQPVFELYSEKGYGFKNQKNYYTGIAEKYDDKLLHKVGDWLYLVSTSRPEIELINILSMDSTVYDLSQIGFYMKESESITEEYRKDGDANTTIMIVEDFYVGEEEIVYLLCYSREKGTGLNTVIACDLKNKSVLANYILKRKGDNGSNWYNSIFVRKGVLYASNNTHSSVDVFRIE
ncbi:hypothetical protein [Echinicola vietnamensis]|uniref:6-bladed beta-propeller n=1 Tax=Echinicola vietnamensis (strain DSM 17526 / LMG 23754 / KMM 6221) TaxID=926556 RepID=L0FYQ7_ECHVK|nr:hypothetical protein [Echinicola vietnamensis]AGA77780.1 hypothetical protein Echvi_1515 [Echinicola vietnamensis DSM 17526]